MLTRIYADNYRCLVNFELHLDRLNLLLGDNGTGKTAVFELLHKLQELIGGMERVQALFPSREMTRWQSRPIQRFELDLRFEEQDYHYTLEIEHTDEKPRTRIRQEKLTVAGKQLYDFSQGEVKLFTASGNIRSTFEPVDVTQSGISFFSEFQSEVMSFRKEISKFVIAGISPRQMQPDSKEEENALSRYMENFVSWYRALSQEHMGAMLGLFEELKQVLPGFSSFSLKDAGEDVRTLKVLFEQPGSNHKLTPYGFNELSDGQRTLIALYTLVFGLKDAGLYLFLDEPDNYVSLREIQPWLTALTDNVGQGLEQAVLISHHPEIINYLARSSGRWFDRNDQGPVRVANQPKNLVQELSPAENIARGWTS